jgi:molecular chaperone DnaJ
MSKRDYYDVLGVNKDSGKDEIKKAYRKLAMKYHPDRNPDNEEAEAKFKEASEAAEVLLDEGKKSRYDQLGHAGVDGQAGSGFGDFSDLGDVFGDIFGDFFGGGGRRGRSGRTRGRPGEDMQMTLDISFTEAAFGIEKKISINRFIKCEPCHGSGGRNGSGPKACNMCSGVGEIRRQQGFFTVATACPKCQGSGSMISDPCASCRGEGRNRKKVDLAVKVPAGIDSGQRLKLSNEGSVGAYGGPSGDLYVLVEIDEHQFFEREGFDIRCTVPVSFSQAALGAELEVPTLTGRVSVKIPSGTQSGKKMRLKSKGIQKLGGYGYGDQIIGIHVETPTKLTSEQKGIFEDLEKLNNKSSHPMARGFFEKVKNLFQ